MDDRLGSGDCLADQTMRQLVCSGRLTWKGYGAGNFGRWCDGSVVVGHFGDNAICDIASLD